MSARVRKIIEDAIGERRGRAAGGCFSEHEPESSDDCHDGTCPCAKSMKRDARAILAALAEAGLAVVPVEPTRAMLDAARDWSLVKYHQGVGDDAASGCYRAMLAAASEDRAPQSTAPLFGSWPGDESDAEVERFLKEIS